MAKRSSERLKADIALLQDFRAHLERFQEHREKLVQLKEKVEGNWMMGMDLNRAESIQRDYLAQLMAERQEVGKRLHEVTEITGRYPLKTQLVIMPPRLIGGYSSSMNLFEAFIQLELPHGYEVRPLAVYDVVDQAIWACEREIKDAGSSDGELDVGTVQEGQAAQNSESSGWKWFGILAGLASIVGLLGLIALCPKPNIDRDITLDERNPFEMQFRVHNGSPWFDLYQIKPVCELLKVEVGNVVLPKGAMVIPEVASDRVEAGGNATFQCHLTPEFKTTTEQVKSADVSLRVNYKWFRLVGGLVKQRIILTHDTSGRPVWLFAGSSD